MGLKYHEDTVQKHKITKEEINFLKELQKEMNTQDTVCQADPRFWVVATDKYKEMGTIDSFDGTELYDSNAAEVACEGDIASIIEYVNENYEDELKKTGIVFTVNNENRYEVCVENVDNKIFEEKVFYDSDDLLNFLQEYNILTDSYELTYYSYVHHNYFNTMFLTNKSCKEHIKSNYYHYADDAHSYAMTAWRSPEVEKLFKILQEVDWDKIS